jgi:hypothetical protein
MKKVINIILTILFFSLMLILTISARSIHHSQIPNVKVKRLTMEDFSGGSWTDKRPAIPKNIIEKGEVYIIANIYINGEERKAARLVYPQLGAENKEYYEVTGGLDRRDLLIVDSSKELNDGVEVYIVE